MELWVFSWPQSRGDNSWYPVYKRTWYPADIRLISLISTCSIRSKHGCFQRFLSFWLSYLCPLISGLYLGLSSRYVLIFCRKLSDTQLKFGQFFSEYPFIIPLISCWYPWYPGIRCTGFQWVVTPWPQSYGSIPGENPCTINKIEIEHHEATLCMKSTLR